jgi:hypothetical protein
MHLFDDRKGILRPKTDPVFRLTPQLPAILPGSTPVLQILFSGVWQFFYF